MCIRDSWASIAFAVLFLLPVVVSSCFGVAVPIGLGLGLWGLLVVFAVWVWGIGGAARGLSLRELACAGLLLIGAGRDQVGCG